MKISFFVYTCIHHHSEVFEKGNYINKLEIVFENQNSCSKSFDS